MIEPTNNVTLNKKNDQENNLPKNNFPIDKIYQHTDVIDTTNNVTLNNKNDRENNFPIDKDYDSDDVENYYDTNDKIVNHITIIVFADDDHIRILKIVKDGTETFQKERKDLFNADHINVSTSVANPKWINKMYNEKYIEIKISSKLPNIWVDKIDFEKHLKKAEDKAAFYEHNTRVKVINTNKSLFVSNELLHDYRTHLSTLPKKTDSHHTQGGTINTYYELTFVYEQVSSTITFVSIVKLPNDYIPSRE